MNTLKRLRHYMGNRKALLPLAMVLSTLSAIAGFLPFIFIWFIVRQMLKGTSDSSADVIITYGLWAAGSAIGGVLFYFVALSSSHLAAFRVEANIRNEAMKRVIRMPLGFFDVHTTGRIRKVIDDNASVTHSFLAHQLPDLAGTILVPFAAVALILFFDWKLGLVCLIPIVFSLLLMRIMMGDKGRSFMRHYMTSLEEMNTEAVEYVRGIPVVKVFQQSIYSFKNFHKSIMNYNKMVMEYTKMWKHPMSTYTIVINGFAFFLVPVAILMIGHSDGYALVLLNFFLYVLVTPVFSECIMKSMYLNQAIGQASEAMDRLDTLLDFRQFADPTDAKPIERHDICFNRVSFTYPGTVQKAVDDVSFRIAEGKTVALVGASGGGKTTIARLVPRFWESEEGEVMIGGVDVKNIPFPELMKHISFVFQNTRLFKTTLLENIMYGNPNATMEEVERAVDLAQCREIINKQPLGLQTKIGTEGTYLSGGEQQRIVLARAILKDAPIVVLDEATAFADPENEHLIQEALKKLRKGKTVLMIAHRLTSVADADLILVVSEGKIAEQGTHAELINAQGVYSNMWNEYCRSIRWTIGKEDYHA